MFAMVTAVSAQDVAEEEETATVEETEAEIIERLSEEELDDLGVDSQEDHTEEDEDVFKPTDAVSYSQSVQFPVDI
jgi:ATP-dependent helicase YprA (DUF1998 family)